MERHTRQTRSEAREAAFTQIFQINQHGDEVSDMIDVMLQEKPECLSLPLRNENVIYFCKETPCFFYTFIV